MRDGGGRSAVEHDLPGVHHQDAVHVLGEFEVVGGQDDLLAETGERAAQEFAVAEVQQRGRLVQDQHLRVYGQDGGQRQELAFAAGELVDALVRQRQEAEPFQDGLGVGPAFLGVADGAPQGQFHVLASGGHDELGERIREDKAHAAADLPHGADGIGAVHPDRALARCHEPVEEPQERGLARAVGADDPDPPFREVQRELLEQRLGRGAAVNRHPHRHLVQDNAAHGRASAVRTRRSSRSGKALCRARAKLTAKTFLMMSPG